MRGCSFPAIIFKVNWSYRLAFSYQVSKQSGISGSYFTRKTVLDAFFLPSSVFVR